MPGILTDRDILREVEAEAIEIEPFDPALVNPASYDLTLGNEVTVYKKWVLYNEFYNEATSGPRNGADLAPVDTYYLDVQEKPETVTFKIDPKRGWVCKPGIGYLMHTRERITTRKYVPIVDGKSSIGRLFVQIHATAGYGDPGFNGQYTLEVIVQSPIKLYPGMRIAQIRFHTLHGDIGRFYDKVGHYTGDAAIGAIPSQAWKQFK